MLFERMLVVSHIVDGTCPTRCPKHALSCRAALLCVCSGCRSGPTREGDTCGAVDAVPAAVVPFCTPPAPPPPRVPVSGSVR
jgi:hypothetical protein